MLTPEQERILQMVKIMLGDIAGNPYYPLLTDQDYITILEYYNWNWKRAIASLGLTIVGMSAGWNTRERVGLEEIENNFSKNYQWYLTRLLDDINSPRSLNITPYASGISWQDWCENNLNPDLIKPELTSIKTCSCKAKCKCGITKLPSLFGGFPCGLG